MRQLLRVVICGILPKNINHVIIRLCFFFNSIFRKCIDPQKLDELEIEAYVILSQLEMFFPPSFVNIMVHLIVHIMMEVRICGRVFLGRCT